MDKGTLLASAIVVGFGVCALRAAFPPIPYAPVLPSLLRAGGLLAANIRSPAFHPTTPLGIHLPSVRALARVCRCAEWGQPPEPLLPNFRTRVHVFSTHAHPTLQRRTTTAAASDAAAATASPQSASHARSRF